MGTTWFLRNKPEKMIKAVTLKSLPKYSKKFHLSIINVTSTSLKVEYIIKNLLKTVDNLIWSAFKMISLDVNSVKNDY